MSLFNPHMTARRAARRARRQGLCDVTGEHLSPEELAVCGVQHLPVQCCDKPDRECAEHRAHALAVSGQHWRGLYCPWLRPCIPEALVAAVRVVTFAVRSRDARFTAVRWCATDPEFAAALVNLHRMLFVHGLNDEGRRAGILDALHEREQQQRGAVALFARTSYAARRLGGLFAADPEARAVYSTVRRINSAAAVAFALTCAPTMTPNCGTRWRPKPR